MLYRTAGTSQIRVLESPYMRQEAIDHICILSIGLELACYGG